MPKWRNWISTRCENGLRHCGTKGSVESKSMAGLGITVPNSTGLSTGSLFCPASVVSDHGGCVASPAREYRHPTSLLPFGDETPHHFSAQTRFYECKQRVQSPVGVPHAEIVIIISRVHRHYLLTTGKTGIRAVNIIDYAGQKRDPVERPVEFGTVIPRPAGRLDAYIPVLGKLHSRHDRRPLRGGYCRCGSQGCHEFSALFLPPSIENNPSVS